MPDTVVIYVMHDTVGGEVEEEAEVEDRPGDHHKYYPYIIIIISFIYYNLFYARHHILLLIYIMHRRWRGRRGGRSRGPTRRPPDATRGAGSGTCSTHTHTHTHTLVSIILLSMQFAKADIYARLRACARGGCACAYSPLRCLLHHLQKVFALVRRIGGG